MQFNMKDVILLPLSLAASSYNWSCFFHVSNTNTDIPYIFINTATVLLIYTQYQMTAKRNPPHIIIKQLQDQMSVSHITQKLLNLGATVTPSLLPPKFQYYHVCTQHFTADTAPAREVLILRFVTWVSMAWIMMNENHISWYRILNPFSQRNNLIRLTYRERSKRANIYLYPML